MLALLRDAFGFADLAEPPREWASRPLGGQDARPPWPLTAIDPAGRVPLVCVPAGSGLDTSHQALGDGHRRRSAFGLVQEFLNTADQALWGICSDGLRLRLVRDNASLTRPALVELDLSRVFTEGLYPDFAAAWLLLHRSRFGRADQSPDTCPLDAWRSAAREEGTLARARLRGGFEDALLTLGQGLLAHPSNQALRQALHGVTLTRHDYFGQLLRLVYRFILLLTVEERGLLHPKGTPGEVQDRYTSGYSFAGARNAAERKRLINELPVRNPELADEWNRESRVAQGTTHFVRQAGRYPLCGKGDINTYALFAEHNWRLDIGHSIRIAVCRGGYRAQEACMIPTPIWDTLLEKAATDNGFDLQGTQDGAWITFASSQTGLRIWLRVLDGPAYQRFGMGFQTPSCPGVTTGGRRALRGDRSRQTHSALTW